MMHLRRFKKTKKTLKAYSLLELIISLAIIAVATTAMMSFLVVSVRISIQSLARSFVREEISNVSVQMSRDIRNADKVVSINCPANGAVCEINLVVEGVQYKWSKCADGSSFRICKDQFNKATGNYDNVSTSSQSVNIDFMDISYGYTQTNDITEANILITISASHANSGLKITNILKQSSASTRNYEF